MRIYHIADTKTSITPRLRTLRLTKIQNSESHFQFSKPRNSSTKVEICLVEPKFALSFFPPLITSLSWLTLSICLLSTPQIHQYIRSPHAVHKANWNLSKYLSFFALLAPYSILASGGSLLDPRANPEGFICSYSLPSCTDSEPPLLGDGETCDNQILPLNTCYRTNSDFQSFVAGTAIGCTNGRRPEIIAYFTTDCTGSGISAGNLPAGGAPSDCVEMYPQGLQIEGKSARFGCFVY